VEQGPLFHDSERVIEEVEKSGLRGRGGAGFPTGRKWRFAPQHARRVKYIVCNADEGDPGRPSWTGACSRGTPSVLKACFIAGYAIGAQIGYVYVRAEYPLAVQHLQMAIKQAAELGLLEDHILGSSFGFHLKIKEGRGFRLAGKRPPSWPPSKGKEECPGRAPLPGGGRPMGQAHEHQ